ncbi:MAG: hypothetical protein ACK5JH_14085 [Anaerocolumna sp.]
MGVKAIKANVYSKADTKTAVIVFAKEMQQDKSGSPNMDRYKDKSISLNKETYKDLSKSFIKEPWDNSSWNDKFQNNIFVYMQKQKPEFKEAVFISKSIIKRYEDKEFDEVFISFLSVRKSKHEFILLKLLPVEGSLSFLLPKYLESILFGILLEVYNA